MAKGETVRGSNWSDVFEAFDLLDAIKRDGFVDITAKQFHQLHLQPRLMTKMDHSHQVPKVFTDNGLSLLTRGFDTWRIGTFEIFQALPEWTLPSADVTNLTIPSYIETLDVTNITGEPGVINAAHAAGLLTDFAGEEQTLTVGGRMRTGDFTFSVKDYVRGTTEIPVSKAQIEIDAGFESPSAFTIYEIKNHLSRDFCARQLFYPYRTWLSRLPKKPIRTVFLTLANDVYDVHEFQFTDPMNYSSAELIKHKRYTIGITRPTEAEIVSRARRVIDAEPQRPATTVPFPQADDFERVMDFVSLLTEEPRTVEDLALLHDIHQRQGDYYQNAARYLGLAETVQAEDGREYLQATSLAREILKLPYREKNLRYADLLLNIKPLAETYFEWVKTGSRPSIDWIADVFDRSPFAVTHKGEKLSESTVRRRAQTIAAWAGWLRAVAE